MDVRIAAYAVVVDGPKLLMAHWNEHGRSGWTLPGGGIEGTEHPADAVVREVFEETGFHIRVEELIGVDTMIVPAESRNATTSPLYALRILYTASIVSGELRPEVGGSSDEAAWWDFADVPTLKRVSLVDIALRLYQDRPAIGRTLR
ncbi:MAG TPA: NUDIX hydrolase [Microbacteriaceae bacterium]|nr:NUDIX hydrolase [Microbacteriaceae bacterium]